MSQFQRQPFRWLLVSLLCLMVLIPADRRAVGDRLLAGGLLTVAFLAGFVVVFQNRRDRAAGLITGLPALAALWLWHLGVELPRVPVVVIAHAASVLFLALTTMVILKTVFHLRDVTADAVAGALCGYWRWGVMFGHVYCLVEEIAPGSFVGVGSTIAPADSGQAHALLTYFSFVTLTTVGYGDITPATGVGRGLAMVEAVLGQFYLAVLVAVLIGKMVARVLSNGDGALRER